MIYKTKLDNGLTIVIDQDKNAKTVTIKYLVAAGSLDEIGDYNGDNNYGVAHFTEHMLFKGTEKRNVNQINDDIAKIGGSTNAFTSWDRTAFYISSPADKWKENLEILNDIFWNSTIPDDELEKERTVIIEELKMYEDKPSSKVHEQIEIKINKNYPNRQLIAGTIDSVSAINSDTIKKFMKCFYQPNNIILIAAGNIPIDEFVVEVNNYVHEKEEGIQLSREIEFNGEEMNNQVIISSRNDISQAHLAFFIKGEPPYSKDFFIQEIFAEALGGNFSSILYSIIREQLGLAYSVKVGNSSSRDSSYIVGYCGLDKKNIDKTHKIIVRELNKLRKQLIDNDKLEIFKNVYRGSALLALESTIAKTSIHEDNFVNNTDYTVDEFLNYINNVTPEDIRNFAKKHFTKKNICFSIVQPK